ncbi:hypothetical protein Anas_08803, partial [Armadillidium nasatum]
TSSRGASRKASESATRPEGDRQSSQNIRESISSFIFSGLDDEPAQTSARQSTSHRSREQPKQTVQQVNEVNIGKSPCARGILGHECRMNLKNAALSCTSGKCHQCQQCGSVPVNDWITCCRDHFLCCRPLARSCQRCDQPLLTSFCNVAFGKCK